MSDHAPAASSGDDRPAPTRDRNVGMWIVVGGVALLVGVIAFFMLAAFLPRWWAQRIGGQVDGQSASGIGLGLFYGSVFTFLALLILWLGFRRRRSWKVWAAWLVAAVIVAIPNLLTLGIVLGRGNAAHAGERILDVEGPYFRGATLVGAIAAVIVFLALQWILWVRRRGKRTEQRLRAEIDARDRERAQPDEPAAE